MSTDFLFCFAECLPCRNNPIYSAKQNKKSMGIRSVRVIRVPSTFAPTALLGRRQFLKLRHYQ